VIVSSEEGCKTVTFKACTSVFDQEGRFNPAYDEDELREAETDVVVVATGQMVDNSFNSGELQVKTRPNGMVYDTRTVITDVPGVFAGGDCVSGPDSVVGAVNTVNSVLQPLITT